MRTRLDCPEGGCWGLSGRWQLRGFGPIVGEALDGWNWMSYVAGGGMIDLMGRVRLRM